MDQEVLTPEPAINDNDNHHRNNLYFSRSKHSKWINACLKSVLRISSIWPVAAEKFVVVFCIEEYIFII